MIVPFADDARLSRGPIHGRGVRGRRGERVHAAVVRRSRAERCGDRPGAWLCLIVPGVVGAGLGHHGGPGGTPPAGYDHRRAHRHDHEPELPAAARLPADPAGGGGAGDRCLGAGSARRLAGSRADAGGQDGIRAGASCRVDLLHGDDGRRGAGPGTAGRHPGAVDAGSGVWVRRRVRPPAAGGRDGTAPRRHTCSVAGCCSARRRFG